MPEERLNLFMWKWTSTLLSISMDNVNSGDITGTLLSQEQLAHFDMVNYIYTHEWWNG